ncbi:MAG: cell division protein FtsL [Alphaproteobacteria bacterium]|nr:MAG: cell division protein FtsL [Alphaproteobacteria bacterium]
MRLLLYILSALIAVGFGFWAYQVNYDTQAALRRVDALNRQIAAERESLTVLRAEWAWLNRPERLAELVNIYRDDLGLGPIRPGHFADIAAIAEPSRPLPAGWDGIGVADIEVTLVPSGFAGPRPHPRPRRVPR